MAWPVLPHGFLGAQGSETDSYRIERSLRFNSADSAYLNRTPASAGNRKTWTWSGWVKRGLINGNFRTLFGVNNGSGSSYFALNITTSETLACSDNANYYRFTTQVFRDPSAWYHIVCVVDTTDATANNRIRFYVNGSEITSFSTIFNPAQNADLGINQAAEHAIGRIATDLRYFDGYLTEINFIDGQALTPSSFGETDAITGRWKAKAYTGDYGVNGFYLNFSDNSGTTATTLGKDSAPISGTHTAANNWTPNNFSASPGAGNDSLTDSPANYGTISTTLTDDTYQIQRSLRFNSADSAYLSRTPASAGNRKTWTWSGWVKRSKIGSIICNIFVPQATNFDAIFFQNDYLYIYTNNNLNLQTNALYRDIGAWMHIVAVYDSTQATASSRIKLYVNGSEVTSFATATYPAQNTDSVTNSTIAHFIGSNNITTNLFDGYMAEINFIDGQALTPDSFGVRDSNYLWKPKAYTGTYGTNGFYLNFSDNSGTTATTLGKDQAGSNNWTPFNFSVASGVGNDSLVDTPTYYGTDSGVGGEVRGNYATWNPLVLNNKTGEASQVFSNANLEVRAFGDGSGSPYTHTQASIAVSTGKYYFEVTHNGSGGAGDGNDNEAVIGIVNLNSSPNVGRGDGVAGDIYSGNGAGYYRGGNFFALGSTVNSTGNTYGSGDIIGVAVDLQNFRVWFSKNGVWQGAGSPNPATNTSPNVSGLPTNGLYAPAVSNYAGASSRRTDFIANFGQRPFAYAAPSGFRALRDYNKIPVPTGGVVRGNYATLNPLAQASSGVTLSDGNLRIATSTTNVGAYGSIGVSSGKWYFELTRLDANNTITVGFSPSGWDRLYVGNSGGGVGYHSNGAIYNNNTILQSGLPTCTTNDIIGVALNLDAGSIAFYKNNSQIGTTITGLSGEWFPAVSGQTSSTCATNFGQRPWAYDAPFGFLPLCTTLLPTPTIQKPSRYMDVVTYTGNGSSQTISSLGFSPDLVWIKSRSSAGTHVLTDIVRGTGKQLFSSSTNSEGSETDQITAFNSNGFSLGANIGGTGSTNQNTTTYVAWAWDEAPIAGMDIVAASLSGTSPVTVNHSLGVAPKMIIGKIRSNTSNWYVNHSGLANNVNYYVMLNSTAAQASSSNIWDGAPTSTSFVVGNPQNGWNGGTVGSANYVFYLFAEVEGFSKFGSYTGNGSTDGPFVWCGFRPRWVMVKRTDTAIESWQIQDSGRSVSNPVQNNIFANGSTAEQIGGADRDTDIVSSGFKLRGNNTGTNASGGTYIFCAFAESPFKYSRAR